jgi:hypothetical protein
LGDFFVQWIRQSGAPELSIKGAGFDAEGRRLTVGLANDATPFDLEVPLRVTFDGGTIDLSATLQRGDTEARIQVDVVPLTVELDPDFHLFRRVDRSQLVPTTATTRSGNTFAAVIPEGELPETLASVRDLFASSFETDERAEYAVGSIPSGALSDRCVLVLGEAVRDSYVEAFLSAAEFPVRWSANGFVFENTEYNDSGDSLLCTSAHPGLPGGAITVLFGNSPEALPRAASVPMYDRSLVVFKKGMPILRRDFEPRIRVPVAR